VNSTKHLKLSIITPVLNDYKGLVKSISSITIPNGEFEHIIVDGGSTDGSFEYAKEYSNNKDTQLLNQKSDGLYGAFNDGLKIARGEYVIYLHCGDTLNILNVFRVINSSLTAEVIACSCSIEDRGKIIEYLRSERPTISFSSTSILFPSLIIKLDAYKKVGGFKESFQVSGDVDCILRMISQGMSVAYSDKLIVEMEQWGVSSKRYYRKIFEHMIIKYDYLGFINAAIYIPKRLTIDFLVLPIWIKYKSIFRKT
tara:strand:- start:1395 stop:2159 length:765 start_codon:yes stop_codon:yes gene_type:complete